MVTYIFRKGSPGGFSIERLFEKLHEYIGGTGAPTQRLELPYASTGGIPILRNLWFVRRQRRHRILHITGDVHYAALLCPFAKTVITVHDCIAINRGTGLKRFIIWLIWFRLPTMFASAIVVISERTREELLELVSIRDNRKLRVIRNFVDPSFVYREHAFNVLQPRILHVGTAPHKNLERVIPALSGLPCMLTIVGQISAQVKSLLAQHAVRYENHVGISHEALLTLYRNADIVSFPSLYEGFGMPILEAQAIGRPVIISDLEPMRSVAGPGGALLVDPASIDAIRTGFLALLADEAVRSRLIRAGLENVQRHALQKTGDSYLDLYRTLLA